MKKKVYQKATMKIMNVEGQNLLAGSGGGPAVMSGTSSNWSEIQ